MSISEQRPHSPTSRLLQRLQAAFLGCSAVLCAVLAGCCFLRPDTWAAVTVFPTWTWLPPGLLLCLAGWRRRPARRRKVLQVSVALLWLCYVVVFVEEVSSFARSPLQSVGLRKPTKSSGVIRVVSLNCGVGNEKAAAEVAAWQPDIVLLQESPGRQATRQLARRLFGAAADVEWGLDASILTRGSLTPVPLPPRLHAHFVQARVRLPSASDLGVTPEIHVVSLRLLPAVFRVDLWSPSCWSDQVDNRQHRRQMMHDLRKIIDRVEDSVPLIVGGDFNAPQGDDVFRLLRPRLEDGFDLAGWGWGNTIINEFPVLRIDQIWADRHFEPVSAFARATLLSDHRMAICDLRLR